MAGRKRKGEEDADENSKKKVQKTGEHNFVCGECGKSYIGRDGLVTHRRMAHRSSRREVPSKARSEVPRDNMGGDEENASKENETRKAKTLKKWHFKCPVCKRAFVRENNLKRHMELYHRNKKKHVTQFACSKCTKRDKIRRNIVYHSKMEHETTDPIKCFYCDAWFVTEPELSAHIKEFHPGKMYRKLFDLNPGEVEAEIENYLIREHELGIESQTETRLVQDQENVESSVNSEYETEEYEEHEELSQYEKSEEQSYDEEEGNPAVSWSTEYCPDSYDPGVGIGVEVEIEEEVEADDVQGEEYLYQQSSGVFAPKHQWVRCQKIGKDVNVCEKCGLRYRRVDPDGFCPEIIECRICTKEYAEIKEKDECLIRHKRCICCEITY